MSPRESAPRRAARRDAAPGAAQPRPARCWGPRWICGRCCRSVTDAATQLAGAKFGAFFYSTTDDEGDAVPALHPVGCAARGVRTLGRPRATGSSARRFEARPRSGATTSCRIPRYGTMAPHHGMPEGHLPVRSYLAVPVTSRTGAVHRGAAVRAPRRRTSSRSAPNGWWWASRPRPASRSTTPGCTRTRSAPPRIAKHCSTASARRATPPSGRATSRTSFWPRSRTSCARRSTRSSAGRRSCASELEGRQRSREGPRGHRAQRARPDAADRRPAGHEPHHLRQAAARHPAGQAGGVHRGGGGYGEDRGRREGDPAGDGHRSRRSARSPATRSRLQQVVWNLLSNAIKFTPQGGRVRVTLERVNSHVEISVADTGMRHQAGVPAAPVRAVSPGRRLHHAPARRPGPGAVDRQDAGRPARRHRDGQRAPGSGKAPRSPCGCRAAVPQQDGAERRHAAAHPTPC